MTPYFETVKSFADVRTTESGIDTQDFLEASDGLVKMFDLFGSAVFGFVQSDIKGNIAGVRARFEATRDKSNTIEHLAEEEAKENKRVAIACLVRLVRGLYFTHQALENTQSDASSELHVCFKRAYDVVLKHHHGFIVRNVVYVAIRAVPHRADFFTCIAQGGSQEKLDTELRKWLDGLGGLVQRIKTFLEAGGYGRV
ncbi:glycolipid transfer protein [Marasmius fiardii PR-910]|nr:glycolipid transfer protein [Marasmius fiardii PR-910]